MAWSCRAIVPQARHAKHVNSNNLAIAIWQPWFKVVNGMPMTTPIGDWKHEDTLKVEWIKSLVSSLDMPKCKEGK